MNFGKGKSISMTQGTMEAWTSSSKGKSFPTLSNKLVLDTETSETFIIVSNTLKSLSIRASSFEERSCFVTDIMI